MKPVIGLKFGQITVTALGDRVNGHRRVIGKCDCGNLVNVDIGNLRSGKTVSCGCAASKLISAARTTHGGRQFPEYPVWCAIKSRCYNPKNRSFKDYGGRGIGMCDRWKDSFEAFISDMGRRPSGNHSVERINNAINYGPDNCKWATRVEQNNNRSNNHVVTHDGVTLTLAQWARRLSVPYKNFAKRVRKGLSIPEAAKWEAAA